LNSLKNQNKGNSGKYRTDIKIDIICYLKKKPLSLLVHPEVIFEKTEILVKNNETKKSSAAVNISFCEMTCLG
jgi:hypothetical protein